MVLGAAVGVNDEHVRCDMATTDTAIAWGPAYSRGGPVWSAADDLPIPYSVVDRADADDTQDWDHDDAASEPICPICNVYGFVHEVPCELEAVEGAIADAMTAAILAVEP